MKNEAYEFWNRFDLLRDIEDIQSVAEKAGIKYRAILSMRSNQSIPKAFDCLTIAQALGVSMEYLLTGETTPAYSPSTPQMKAIYEGLQTAHPAVIEAIYRMLVTEDSKETVKRNA